jgi:hypothetical protein
LQTPPEKSGGVFVGTGCPAVRAQLSSDWLGCFTADGGSAAPGNIRALLGNPRMAVGGRRM